MSRRKVVMDSGEIVYLEFQDATKEEADKFKRKLDKAVKEVKEFIATSAKNLDCYDKGSWGLEEPLPTNQEIMELLFLVYFYNQKGKYCEDFGSYLASYNTIVMDYSKGKYDLFIKEADSFTETTNRTLDIIKEEGRYQTLLSASRVLKKNNRYIGTERWFFGCNEFVEEYLNKYIKRDSLKWKYFTNINSCLGLFYMTREGEYTQDEKDFVRTVIALLRQELSETDERFEAECKGLSIYEGMLLPSRKGLFSERICFTEKGLLNFYKGKDHCLAQYYETLNNNETVKELVECLEANIEEIENRYETVGDLLVKYGKCNNDLEGE